MLTVGEILRTEREKQGLSLQSIEKKIRIRSKFLSAVEKNDWSQFSSNVYISGIIKNYAAFLGLNSDRALAFFRREYEKREEEASFKGKLSKRMLISERRRSTLLGLTAVAVLFFSYFGYQIYRYLAPPTVNIYEPTESVFRRVDRVTVIGKTEKEAVITIFDSRVFQDERGNFHYDFPLKQGKNNFVIKVVGANGKTTTLKREYFLDP